MWTSRRSGIFGLLIGAMWCVVPMLDIEAQAPPELLKPTKALSSDVELVITLPGNVPLVMVKMPLAGAQLADSHSASGQSDMRLGLSYISKNAITQRQWRAVMGYDWHPSPAITEPVNDDDAVNDVPWASIAGPKGFINRLDAHLRQLGATAGDIHLRAANEAEVRLASASGVSPLSSFYLVANQAKNSAKSQSFTASPLASCTSGQSQSIGCSQTLTGTLTTSDCTLSDGSYAKIYHFTGSAGTQVAIDLTSLAFDTYLVLFNSSFTLVALDDDGGGGTNSRIVYTLPQSGDWYIAANAFFVGSTGSYTLRLQCNTSPTSCTSGQSQSLGCNQNLTGSLTTSDCTLGDGTYAKIYHFTGNAGTQVTIDMTSSAFDSYLILFDSSFTSVAQDDDSGGGTDSRIVYTLPRSGDWYVAANAFFVGSTGSYTLRLQCNTNPCASSSKSACLLNGRFRATVRFRGQFDNAPTDTDALVKSVTGFADPSFETAFFYFNSSSNIELMLKVLDQGNTDSQGHRTIAVLFGTATPLRVEVTITDTVTGVTRKYTSSFGDMRGTTDFTAFVK